MAAMTPLEELKDLLGAYDHANRLEIDALYAQFSPTLDDFYAEDLRIDFTAALARYADAGGRRPDLILTRTVAGLEPKQVRSRGAAFPLARAEDLVRKALTAAAGSLPFETLRRLDAGTASLAPTQVPRTQRVVLRIEPDGVDVMTLLGSP